MGDYAEYLNTNEVLYTICIQGFEKGKNTDRNKWGA
ncbi:uncharacterized protein Nmag_0240 [Natrialba magadii ATCC 43099]|uniref:Uncharacterized protein n=1 Tax=Natrialba magadii (strain ATCC 43099 / DSM 3394 / CCM 3739 / CIP 104546 / IAM 13178 / JCM 8861 / NBRC 102185 / NCIMB 2190 / MS3) TaxID=547559 RepID=D3SX12_NATMM|nr:uncharacterized protein Nmag_0240 [Natrialba magadii ATCC 43099]